MKNEIVSEKTVAAAGYSCRLSFCVLCGCDNLNAKKFNGRRRISSKKRWKINEPMKSAI